MKNRLFPTLIALVLCLAATAALAGGIKERMIERKPAVDALLAQGVIGENNIGLLEYRGAKQDLAVVSEENKDRFTVYEAIARKTGTDKIVVGQRRAAQIAQMAPAGTWLQRPEGTWYQK
jgi:hypothetical protein